MMPGHSSDPHAATWF